MGCIYKVTNLINNKIYIGLTSYPLQKRINNHIYNSNRDNPKSIFHKAIKKYGITNFKFEILEDNIFQKSILRERENFYILENKSYLKDIGYNYTLGGEGESLFLGRENEVIQKYNELLNCNEVAKYFNCDRQVIARVLKQNNVKILCGTGVRKRIKCIELNKEFNSMRECANYLIVNNYINNIGLDQELNISKYISNAICKNKKYKGFSFIIINN